MKILVTGSRTGLGAAIASDLSNAGHFVVGWDVKDGNSVLDPPHLKDFPHGLDVLINCAGVNDIGPLEEFTEDRWDRVMDTNVKGIYKMTRALLPLLLDSCFGVVVNIVSNAAHIPMTHSLAYNASKGAAHIMTKQLAREFKGRLTVFGIAPNKLAGTEMSQYIDKTVPNMRGWSPEQAKQYQLNSLPAGEETPPELVADFISFLLSTRRRHQYLTGCILPYGT